MGMGWRAVEDGSRSRLASLAPSSSQARHLPHFVREEKNLSPVLRGRWAEERGPLGGSDSSHQHTNIRLSADLRTTFRGHTLPTSQEPLCLHFGNGRW